MIAQGRWEEARHAAHTLKGAAANVSARRLSRMARNLEEACGRQDPGAARQAVGLALKELDELGKIFASPPSARLEDQGHE
jgi:HPt (histidine-containing phosphotransfer) domain-containing protein